MFHCPKHLTGELEFTYLFVGHEDDSPHEPLAINVGGRISFCEILAKLVVAAAPLGTVNIGRGTHLKAGISSIGSVSIRLPFCFSFPTVLSASFPSAVFIRSQYAVYPYLFLIRL